MGKSEVPVSPPRAGDGPCDGESRVGDAVSVPLTEAQAGMWYAQRMDPANPVFNTGQCVDLRGELDVEAFRLAVDGTMVEADALAMRVIDAADTPRQLIDDSRRARLALIDLRDEADALAQARAEIDADMSRPIDLEGDALTVQRLYRIGERHYLWYMRVHHIATDGYGMALVEQRVAQRYRAARCDGDRQRTGGDGDDDRADALLPYTRVLAEDREYRESARREQDATFWREQFAGMAPVVGLAEGAPVSAHRYLHTEAALPDAVSHALQALAQSSDVAWPDILVALSAAYLYRHTWRGDDVEQGAPHETVVGVPWMGRLGSASARVPAMVMNIVPLRVTVDEQAPLADFLVAVARGLRKARRHGRYRSEQLRRDLGLLGGHKRLYGPLINVLPFDAPLALPGIEAARGILGTGPVDDLTFTFRADAGGGGLWLAVDANPGLYRDADIAAHLQRLTHFLATALAAPKLAAVPTLSEAEAHRWLVEVNQTAHPVPQTTLWALIARSMRDRPEAIALEYENERLDYAALNARSAALALRLKAVGVGRGDIVAVALPRSLELVVALLATMRLGAAYLPLDIAHPRERLARIFASAKPRAALSIGALRAALPDDAQTQAHSIWLDEVEAENVAAARAATLVQGADADAVSAAAALPGPEPFDAAYVIYTSGSTGEPKGVVVEHDAIVNRLLWMQAHYGIGADERILQKTPATFDVSVWEFFLPLIAGATLVVAPPEAHRDPAWLADIMRRQRITTLHFVPSMLAAFLAEPAIAGLRPRRVFCSGEALPAALRDQFHARLDSELHNLYGPTEAAVDVTWWPAARDDHSQPVPIGFPVWNTALYVLDDALRPVPPGVVGHLYLAGRQLARGYLGRPDLTEARFVPDPFGAPGARMYATGDLARWRDDGAMVFLGRSDHQVKLRGQRIELGEIEAVLEAAPGVARAAVIVRADKPGEQHIVAYVVPTSGPQGAATTALPVDVEALRQHAAAHLPDYMLPSAVLVLQALPVTANGKLDRAALPAPVFAGSAGRAPHSATEQRVAALFARVLARDTAGAAAIGADDDFFALGGHSLLAARLALIIRTEWECALGLGAVFEHPTVARLAAYLDERTAVATPAPAVDAGFGPVLRLRPDDGGRTPLFWIHPAGGLSWCYGALTRAIEPARPVYGIQARAFAGHANENEVPARLGDMAADYVDTVLRLQAHGPYHLAGWSVGGIIAQAMAVELRRRGHAVGLLAMLDAYPSDCWRDQPEPPPESVYKALLHIAGHDPSSLPDVPLTRDGVIAFLRHSGHPLGELSDAMLAGVIQAVAGTNRLVRAYRHERYDGPALYFRAALDHVGENLSPSQWAPYVASLKVHDIPALHAHLTGAEATARIAPVLNERLRRFDAGAAPLP